MASNITVKKFLHVGPGGLNCPCCIAIKRSRHRKYMFRSAKRRALRDAFRCEKINS